MILDEIVALAQYPVDFACPLIEPVKLLNKSPYPCIISAVPPPLYKPSYQKVHVIA